MALTFILVAPVCAEEPAAAEAELDSPLPVNDTISPRISLIGPAGTRVSLVVEVDGERICEFKGRLDATAHRAYEEGMLIADGVCHGDAMPTSEEHEFAIRGSPIPAASIASSPTCRRSVCEQRDGSFATKLRPAISPPMEAVVAGRSRGS